MKYGYGREMLNRCQRVGMCASMCVCRTVSTVAMQVLMGDLPWDLECVKRNVCFRLKNDLGLNENDLVTDDEVQGLSMSRCKELVHERAIEVWQDRWDVSEKRRVMYEWIRDVRFASRNEWFDFGMSASYLLTGHGSKNQFLFKRGLAGSECCMCGEECDDWKHVLSECPMYEDERDLDAWGVRVDANGSVDVSGVLDDREKFERVCVFAKMAFARRREYV